MVSRRSVHLALAFILAVPAARSVAADPAQVKNARARAEAARKVYETMLLAWQEEPPGPRHELSLPRDLESFYRWSRRWAEAESESAAGKDGRVAAAGAHLDRMKKWEQFLRQLRKKGGLVSGSDVAAAEFFRLEAESWLEKEKAR
jgi:hypothetical protein